MKSPPWSNSAVGAVGLNQAEDRLTRVHKPPRGICRMQRETFLGAGSGSSAPRGKSLLWSSRAAGKGCALASETQRDGNPILCSHVGLRNSSESKRQPRYLQMRQREQELAEVCSFASLLFVFGCCQSGSSRARQAPLACQTRSAGPVSCCSSVAIPGTMSRTPSQRTGWGGAASFKTDTHV